MLLAEVRQLRAENAALRAALERLVNELTLQGGAEHERRRYGVFIATTLDDARAVLDSLAATAPAAPGE